MIPKDFIHHLIYNAFTLSIDKHKAIFNQLMCKTFTLYHCMKTKCMFRFYYENYFKCRIWLISVYESFDDYIKQESLEGDNKYDAGDYGLQVKYFLCYHKFIISKVTVL